MNISQEKRMQQIFYDKLMIYAGNYFTVQPMPGYSFSQLESGVNRYCVGDRLIMTTHCALDQGSILLFVIFSDGSVVEKYTYEEIKNCDIAIPIRKVLSYIKEDMDRAAKKYAESIEKLEDMASIITDIVEKE
jgi:hypothetical protein